MRGGWRFISGAFLAVAVTGCSQPAPKPAANSPTRTTAAAPKKLAAEHLPNAYLLNDKVISGGLPEEAGFAELQELGVKTVISVDGATPDLATAKKYGLRYVHLPHGYDGIPDARIQELAKAVQDLPGPIYIHCHHGKHRSPAAAAVACVGAGLMEPSAAITVLKMAGTSDKYRGLYEAAEHAHPFDQKLLDALQVEFRETAPVPPLAHDMVEIEHLHDRLVQLQKAGWEKGEPREQAAHSALLLREQFTELLRAESVTKESAGFQERMHASEAEANKLETLLQISTPEVTRLAEERQALERITAGCATCHKEYRDRPLSEKLHLAPLR